jgi:Ca2+-binding EF-hand superfamily protein
MMGRTFSLSRNATIKATRKLDFDEIFCLEEAYKVHVAAFDQDGDQRISVEELIIILDRCRLFDEFFTPFKVRNHFNTWADGCNHHCLTKPLGDDGIGFAEFENLLRWAADVKCVDFGACVQKVVRLSSKLCDKAASIQRRLEVVFDTFGKQDNNKMSAFEFGNLCRKLDVPFCMGDIFLLFSQHSGGLKEGVDFEGFICVLREVGNKLKVGDEIFATFARAVELMDTDEATLTRIKMRLRQAAGIVGGDDWKGFLLGCDHNGSVDWPGFLHICREKLHLADKDSNLRILFERLDIEASGEISIQVIIDFMHAH